MAEYILKMDLIINNIIVIQKDFAKHISRFNHLSLIIEKNLDIDISGLQLLYSIKSYMVKNNRSISIKYEGNEYGLSPFLLSEFEELIK